VALHPLLACALDRLSSFLGVGLSGLLALIGVCEFLLTYLWHYRAPLVSFGRNLGGLLFGVPVGFGGPIFDPGTGVSGLS
jgi:hypothetical protein